MSYLWQWWKSSSKFYECLQLHYVQSMWRTNTKITTLCAKATTCPALNTNRHKPLFNCHDTILPFLSFHFFHLLYGHMQLGLLLFWSRGTVSRDHSSSRNHDSSSQYSYQYPVLLGFCFSFFFFLPSLIFSLSSSLSFSLVLRYVPIADLFVLTLQFYLTQCLNRNVILFRKETELNPKGWSGSSMFCYLLEHRSLGVLHVLNLCLHCKQCAKQSECNFIGFPLTLAYLCSVL